MLRRLLLGLLLGLLPLVVLVVAAELALMLLGLGGGDGALPLSRGFDPAAAYLVPDGSAPGAWRTQIFDGLGDEVVIPPKGEAVRVLLLGGSNTQSFPHAELQRRLDAAAGAGEASGGATDDGPHGAGGDGAPSRGARRFEVINLGRAGYGSERVAILGEQALRLQPDVVVIYSGHNEFVEGGFRIEVQGAAPGWLARLGGAFAGLRSFRVLADALGGDDAGREEPPPGGAAAGEGGGSGGVDAAPAPETVMLGAEASATVTIDGEEVPLGRLDPSETQVFYAAYEANLRRLCTRLLDAGVGVVLCTVVSNDMLGPTASSYPRGLSAGARAEAGRHLKRGFELVPERLKAHMFPPTWLRVHDWGELLFAENPEQRPRAEGRNVPRLRELRGRLAEAPATSGRNMQSVAGAHWPDPGLWSDRVFDLLEVQSAWLHGPFTADERERLLLARQRFDGALQIVPDHPLAHFWLGLCLLAAGDGRGAAGHLVEAGRHDRAPRRGNAVTNDIVEHLAFGLASGRDDATPAILLDADALFRGRVPDGILGYEVMMDMCHLQPGARVVLMDDLVAPVRAVAGR